VGWAVKVTDLPPFLGIEHSVDDRGDVEVRARIVLNARYTISKFELEQSKLSLAQLLDYADERVVRGIKDEARKVLGEGVGK